MYRYMLSTVYYENGSFTLPTGTLRAKQFNKNNEAYSDLANYVGATVTINLGTDEVNKSRKLYARGYVVLETEDGYEIHYADDVVSGTYNDGFKVR